MFKRLKMLKKMAGAVRGSTLHCAKICRDGTGAGTTFGDLGPRDGDLFFRFFSDAQV
jgi:hypothetical protein